MKATEFTITSIEPEILTAIEQFDRDFKVTERVIDGEVKTAVEYRHTVVYQTNTNALTGQELELKDESK